MVIHIVDLWNLDQVQIHWREKWKKLQPGRCIPKEHCAEVWSRLLVSCLCNPGLRKIIIIIITRNDFYFSSNSNVWTSIFDFLRLFWFFLSFLTFLTFCDFLLLFCFFWLFLTFVTFVTFFDLLRFFVTFSAFLTFCDIFDFLWLFVSFF